MRFLDVKCDISRVFFSSYRFLCISLNIENHFENGIVNDGMATINDSLLDRKEKEKEKKIMFFWLLIEANTHTHVSFYFTWVSIHIHRTPHTTQVCIQITFTWQRIPFFFCHILHWESVNVPIIIRLLLTTDSYYYSVGFRVSSIVKSIIAYSYRYRYRWGYRWMRVHVWMNWQWVTKWSLNKFTIR